MASVDKAVSGASLAMPETLAVGRSGLCASLPNVDNVKLPVELGYHDGNKTV